MNKLKNQKKIILKFSLVTLCFLLLTSCNSSESDENESCATVGWAEAYAEAQTELNEASQAYASDPSFENCTNLVNASFEFANVFEEYKNCLPEDTREGFAEAAEEIRLEAENRDCSS